MNVKFAKLCMFLAAFIMLWCEAAWGHGPGVVGRSKVKEVLTPGNRRALVGKSCMLNTVYGGINVISGSANVGALCDNDLENYMTFTSAVSAKIGADPVLTVKDMNHHYKDTYAGFRVSDEPTTAIGIDLLKSKVYYIKFYCEGKQVGEDTQAVQGFSSFSTLELSIGGGVVNNAFCEYYAPSPKDEAGNPLEFDEIGFYIVIGGVGANVYSEVKVQYAFVGQVNEFNIVNDGDGNNLKGYAEYLRSNYGLDTTPEEWVASGKRNWHSVVGITDESDLVVSGEETLAVDGQEYIVSVDNGDAREVFPAGTEVGFIYDKETLLELNSGVLKFVFYPKEEGKESETVEISANALKVGLLSGAKGLKTSIIAPIDCSGFSYWFNGMSGISATYLQHAFVRIPTDVPDAHHCPINASLDADACDCDGYFMLRSKMPVKWECVSAPSEEAKSRLVFEDASEQEGMYMARVVGFSVSGEYVFRATAEDGCYEETHVRYGMAKPYEPDPKKDGEIYLINTKGTEYKLSSRQGGGIIIGSPVTDQPGNILTPTLSDFTTLDPKISLVENVGIIGVRTTDMNRNLADGFEGDKLRVGFVVSSGTDVLSADVLKLLNIALYNDGEEVLRKVVVSEKAVNASLIGDKEEQKYRYTIEIDKAGLDFDEVILFSSGVLGLNLSTLKIYYAFVESAEHSNSQDPYYGSTLISYDNTGASFDWTQSGNFNLVSIGSGISEWSALIDDDLTTGIALPTGVNVVNAQLLKVNVGRTVSPRQQLVVVMDEDAVIGLLGAKVTDVILAKTYLNGVLQEEINSWEVLGADVLKINENHGYMSFTPTKPFDQVELRFGSGADVLGQKKIYGLVIRDDTNGDGIPNIIDTDPYPCDATPELVLDENFDLDKAENQYVGANLFFQRKFVAGKWNSLIMPVDLSAEQFGQAFGKDAKLSEIDRVVKKTEEDGGVVVVIRFKDANPHEKGLRKNVPYIINITEEKIGNQLTSYTSSDAAINGPNRTVAAGALGYSPSEDFGGTIFVVTCGNGVEYNTSDDYLKYEEDGEVSVAVENDDNISQGTIKTPVVFNGSFASKQMLNQGDYIFNNGDMYHLTKSNHWMRGYRCWFSSAEEGESLPAKMTFSLVDDMGNTTAIDSIDGVETSVDNAVYNINGQKVNATTHLHRGIYIKNGRKFIVQ